MHLLFRKFVLSLLLFFCVIDAFTQKVDTLEVKKHSPKKATIMSAVLPGSGQFYNKKYWKIPVIYVGFGTLVYFISANQKQYNNYKQAYKYRVDNDPATVDNYLQYSAEGLLQAKNYYRRNLEISYIFTSVLYMLNVVDATVDAHLFDFDISNDLSLKIQPSFLNSPYAFKSPFTFKDYSMALKEYTMAIKITLKLKN